MGMKAHRQGSALDVILAKLDRVKVSGNGYRAQCPACGGRTQKLSLRETDDGKVLLNCFGGCAALEVTGALGLALSDLYPEPLPATTDDQHQRRRQAAQQADWGAAIEVLEFEARIVAIAGRELGEGKLLDAEDAERLAEAVQRIERARSFLMPRREHWRPRVSR